MEKIQIDKYLGGTCDLPRSVTLMDFLAARAPELAAFNHAIENSLRDDPEYSKNPPMHMRRTLMSHNQNRLPRRVLEAIKKKKIVESSPKVQNINQPNKKKNKKNKKNKTAE